MKHQMQLGSKPFKAIKIGIKDIEIRLNDPKRQKIKIGDTIEFSLRTNPEEKLLVKVQDLYPFETFEHLYDNVESEYFKKWKKEHFLVACRCIYTKEKEAEHGALGIKLKLLGETA